MSSWPNTMGINSPAFQVCMLRQAGDYYIRHVDRVPERRLQRRNFRRRSTMGRGVIPLVRRWLANRPNEVIWLGRVKGRSNDERASIVEEAKKYINRPYDFWNFDLNDDHGFYCSKLVWLSVFRSLSFAIDGNSNPERAFWFSPKQLLYLPAIDRIHDPGPYAVR